MIGLNEFSVKAIFCKNFFLITVYNMFSQGSQIGYRLAHRNYVIIS